MAALKNLGIVIKGEIKPEFKEILTPEALKFVVAISRKFEATRQQLLRNRRERQQRLDRGEIPAFLPETAHIRSGTWKCAPIPKDLQDRRVEITGPTSAKMVINALNSGAKVFMADFEDANSPTWENGIEGQLSMKGAANLTLQYTAPDGKKYKLNPQIAVLMVRPRGWHLNENHFLVDGQPISASIFDFGLHFFHNAKTLLARGSGPYFYLPKMESHLEARLWNDIFNFSEEYLGLPKVIRATVLIETILAAYEMDEILYELREHSAGLNCGRWDYIFSVIKKFIRHPQYLMGDRANVTMTAPFMNAYVQLLIKTCHRREIQAMGGMAAQIPIRDDAKANAAATEKVRADKLREVQAGHDGTWVAHPALIPIAMEVFNAHMPTPNQIHVKRADVSVAPRDLLEMPTRIEITEAGMRGNIAVSLLYLEAWLRGNGCVPIYNLMEDLATAEIARSQLYQWVLHGAKLNDGRVISKELVLSLIADEAAKLRQPNLSALGTAVKILEKMVTQDSFAEFMSLETYPYICKYTSEGAKL